MGRSSPLLSKRIGRFACPLAPFGVTSKPAGFRCTLHGKPTWKASWNLIAWTCEQVRRTLGFLHLHVFTVLRGPTQVKGERVDPGFLTDLHGTTAHDSMGPRCSIHLRPSFTRAVPRSDLILHPTTRGGCWNGQPQRRSSPKRERENGRTCVQAWGRSLTPKK